MNNKISLEINNKKVIPDETSSETTTRPDTSTVEESLVELENKFETFGAAKSATKLYTKRKIGNAEFDGTKDISLEDIANNASGDKDGLMSSDDKTKLDGITSDLIKNWNDANSKKHSHTNKSILDGITSALIDTWNKVTDKLDKTGDASNTTNTITTASTRTNLKTGEKLSVSLGKIAKYFADLKNVAFSGSYKDLSDKPTSMTANGGNADTVNGHTVKLDVPADAKFTDTVYTHPTTSGNKHIPSGGSSGQVLGWQSDGTAKWMTNDSSGGYINLGQFNSNNRTINLDIYKPYAECDSKGDNTTWFVPNDRNCVAWIRSKENTGTNPPQFGGNEIWFYFRSTMVNGMPLQEIIVYCAVNDGTPKNTYLNRAYCNAAWTSWWGDTDYLKLIGGVMTGPINFASGGPIQMKPASWTGYVQTLVCDGNVKVGVNNFGDFFNNVINLIMLSTAATYIRWKAGNGCYFQTINNAAGNLSTKLAITDSLVTYGLPLYEVINGTAYRVIAVNTSANLHIGGNTQTGNNNIAAIFMSLLNCQYGFYNTAFRVMEAYDNKVSLGSGYARWSQVYAKNNTISTSDRNLKHDINDIDDKLIELFFKIKSKTFYFNDGDRIHVGLIAQDFEESMKELDLSVDDYGMICKDPMYEYTEFDEDGIGLEDSKVIKKDEDGNPIYIYSFRYGELITLTIQVVQNQQKEINDLKKETEELKSEVNTLKSEIENLKAQIEDIKSSLSTLSK